uniref:Trimethylguanosine synthase n=1 Tax=Candidozyma auris TaxID=498019 RepID=A0A0L0NQM5_CANAR
MTSDFVVNEDDELLMHNYHTLPENCKKYWRKRYKLFSKFDEGIYLTSELWYSVTPESVAKYTASYVKLKLKKCRYILDVCCGGGGNTIQFAKVCKKAVGVDINGANIKCCKQNASVYGVCDTIEFIQGDWHQLKKETSWIPLRRKKFDFAFCSPPWGGPNYNNKKFDLEKMEPFDLRTICVSLKKISSNFGLFLPRSLDVQQIRDMTRELYGLRHKARLVYVYSDEHLVGLLVFFGKQFQ